MQHERTPYYAPVEHEYLCNHYFDNVITHGESFNKDWVDGINDLKSKIFDIWIK